MRYDQGRRPSDGGDLWSWIVAVILLVSPLWFVGLLLLVRKLGGLRRRPQFPYLGPSPGTQGVRTPPPNRRAGGLDLGKGKLMTVGGAIMAILFGFFVYRKGASLAIATIAGRLHGFDPAGIAVDDFRQSLVVQARALGLDGDDLAVFTSFVYDCLELLKAGKKDEIARRLKVDREDVDALESFLKTLSPYPASAFSSSLERVIVPDVSIKVEEGHLRVRVNDDALPELSIDEGYKEMAGELSKSSRSDEKEASRYLKSQMQAAGNLIRQIELRMSTLERVASVLAVRQKAFFLFGPGNIKPLTLKDVAAEIGVHEATVSRITQGKYVDTDWGIIPMKSLFSSAVRTSDGEDSLSKEAVKEMVRKIILDNDTGKPLSDQKISDTLKAKGINCARRTVNKYRKELDIDSSFERAK